MSTNPGFMPRVIAKQHEIRGDTIALRVIFDPIEDDRRPSLGAFVDDLCESRKLEIPVNVLNGHELTDFLYVIEPRAEVRHKS